jgi:NAD(P) transhydrogenase subunit alpha
MLIFAPQETDPHEPRAAVTPETAARLVKLGATVAVESGIGAGANYPDAAYEKAGATVRDDRAAALREADMVLRVRRPPDEEVALLNEGAVHLSFLDPFNETDLVDALAQQGVSAISMELVPRSTRAQKLDALSSQHSIAGYAMVLMAADQLKTILPMMVTPSGTLQPARVFVIGAGVAGLQAIATAKRLGARVEAFDVRPDVAEQVESLGARFVKVDLGETGQTEQGYAKALTPEQLDKQRAAMADRCAQSDIVITTAQLFGRKAPVVVTADMVRRMQPGSILVDYAVESGGNVEGSRPGEDVNADGVLIIGYRNIPGRLATSASQMYANNLYNFVAEFWDAEGSSFTLNRDDEIISGSLVTHGGALVNEMVKSITGQQPETAKSA